MLQIVKSVFCEEVIKSIQYRFAISPSPAIDEMETPVKQHPAVTVIRDGLRHGMGVIFIQNRAQQLLDH